MHTIRLHCEKAVVATLRQIIQLGQLCHDNGVVLFRRPTAYYCNGAAIVLERSSYRVLYQCSTLWRRTKKKVDRTMTASIQLVSVRNVHSVPSTYDASISNQTLHNSRLFPRTTAFNQRSYSTSSPVSTGMGDRPRTGTPSRYVNSQLGRLSPASLLGR